MMTKSECEVCLWEKNNLFLKLSCDNKFWYIAPVTCQIDQLPHDARAQQREEDNGGADCEARHGDHPFAHRRESHPDHCGCHSEQVSMTQGGVSVESCMCLEGNVCGSPHRGVRCECRHVCLGEGDMRDPLPPPARVCPLSGPREDATRIGSAGVVKRQAVDISPLRRVNQALMLLTTGAREASFRNIKTIAECLADELINASKGSSNRSALLGLSVETFLSLVHWLDF